MTNSNRNEYDKFVCQLVYALLHLLRCCNCTAFHFRGPAPGAPWAPGDRLPGIWGRTPFLLHPENPTYAAVRVIMEVSCRRNIAHNTLSTQMSTPTADRAQSTLIRSWKYLKHSAAIGGMVGHVSRTRPPIRVISFQSENIISQIEQLIIGMNCQMTEQRKPGLSTGWVDP